MGDEIKAVTEGAKAVQEGAKMGRALVEAGSDLARFVGKALDTVPDDAVGLLGGDYLHHLRIRNLDKISRKTEEILRKRGVEEPQPIGPKALLPALEAASEETDETLQDMWAELLANAMDPNKDTSLQHLFIDTLRQMESVDALVFKSLAETSNVILKDGDIAERLHWRETKASISADRLADLGVLRPMGDSARPSYIISALGTELYLACGPDASD